jgi:AcrR family transcriptional regulator
MSPSRRPEPDDAKPRAKRRAARAAGGDTRAELLATAVRLLAEHDIDGFSLRQVAEAAGYAPPTVYLHFADKDDLLYHAAREGFAAFGDALARAAAGETDPIVRIEAIGRAYVAFGLSHPVQYRLMFLRRGDLLWRSSPDCPPLVDGFDTLVDAVEAAMAAGRLDRAPAGDVANWLWAWTHGVVSLHLTMPHVDAGQALALLEQGLRVMRHGLYRTP